MGKGLLLLKVEQFVAVPGVLRRIRSQKSAPAFYCSFKNWAKNFIDFFLAGLGTGLDFSRQRNSITGRELFFRSLCLSKNLADEIFLEKIICHYIM
jgi:hypothetical protein